LSGENQVCLIRETKNTRSVGVPPGTGLGNTDAMKQRNARGNPPLPLKLKTVLQAYRF